MDRPGASMSMRTKAEEFLDERGLEHGSTSDFMELVRQVLIPRKVPITILNG